MRRVVNAVLVTILLLTLAQGSHAQVVFSTGAGSAVFSIDRSATFNAINANGIDLSTYTEGLLSITVPDVSFVGFDAFGTGNTSMFHYGSGGNNSFVRIRGTDAATMYGLEFLLGSGFASSTVRITWETYLGGFLTGSGSSTHSKGTIVGWSDGTGFDELRVIADEGTLNGAQLTFGEFQAIALDDLNVDLTSAIPEPGSLSLLGIGLGLLGARLRRRAKSRLVSRRPR